MQHHQHNGLVNFIWNIADNVLRDLYIPGKYRDVILSMTEQRRLDAVLEPTKQAVLGMKSTLDQIGIENQGKPPHEAAGETQPVAVFANIMVIGGVGDVIRSGGTWC